jgi:hypothetical protein
MGYIESSLLPGEAVVARAHLHWIVFVRAIFVLILGGTVAYFEPISGGVISAVGLLMLIPPLITRASSEFAVTSKRVVIKVGVVQRKTLELLLRQIEAISVDQSLSGRVLNYGTITVMGTGGVRESFKNISRPLEFRRAVHRQSGERDVRDVTA